MVEGAVGGRVAEGCVAAGREEDFDRRGRRALSRRHLIEEFVFFRAALKLPCTEADQDRERYHGHDGQDGQRAEGHGYFIRPSPAWLRY